MENQVLEIIKKRRSTRIFLDKPIENESIHTIIEAGCYAPSGYNRQPWFFVVISNKEILDKLSVETKQSLKLSNNEHLQEVGNNPNFHVFYNAPTAILVCGDESDSLYTSHCSVATQNMLLAAESLSIGSCWIGVINSFSLDKNNKKLIEEYKEKFKIPNNYKISHAIALGYRKNEIAKASPRKENVYTIIK
ncbi:MAG: hypothetical protein A2086_01595 [Spirochaetes bacterium GWD1_27_9]|nr:MAG: hypothetical protein A2Z98_08950 [Spirochaetes bacterium GWB1_27_13]OHD28055.1 MAG: hypothetical protein A2Y34_02615 [Spirochaetes bacterium GWC1_27_15]OHD41769.1 MAG: hypothetical protein A2086_01595 [Spirochaetes bacterium GWD1_27_9]